MPRQRHGKRKYAVQTQKRTGKQAVAPHPEAAAMAGAVKLSAEPLPESPRTLQYSYVRGELIRIGVLTGIVFLFLIALALVF